jgi:hypothetical protein
LGTAGGCAGRIEPPDLDEISKGVIFRTVELLPVSCSERLRAQCLSLFFFFSFSLVWLTDESAWSRKFRW